MVKLNAGGAASGALTGAYVGSQFGTVGTIAGGAIGGITGLFGGGGKKKKKPKKISRLDPYQEEIYGRYRQSLEGQGPYAGLYDFDEEGANKVFDETIARYANRNFEEKTAPTITGAYRQSNLMNSSYSADALSKAGRDVNESLNAQRAKYIYKGQQEAREAKRDAIRDILDRQTFDYEKPEEEEPGMFDSIIGGLGKDAGDWLSTYLKNNAGGGGGGINTGGISSGGGVNPKLFG